MKKRTAFLGGLVAIVGGIAVYASTLRVTRPPAPPADAGSVYPWGALSVDEDGSEAESDLERALRQSFGSKGRLPAGGARDYSILVLTGGGSGGAFGAGFLTGWTASGERPDFRVVAGISTGSLQATFAFLGPDYDDELTEVFTEVGTEDIYETRGVLHAIVGDAGMDSAPLKELIDRYVDDDLLAAVARRYAAGHRLFVGTANMDTGEFVSWDMGAIAASSRPDKLERYRHVLLASCSIPVLFPPVYFDIEVDGETYYEMHMDGGAQSQLFLRGFLFDLEAALVKARMLGVEIRPALYVVRNGAAGEQPLRTNVDPSSVSIAAVMISRAFDLSLDSSLYRMYVLSNRYGLEFNMAALPDDVEPDLDPVIFDREQMRRIYDWAHAAARRGYEWRKAPPGLGVDEILRAGGVEASQRKR